MTDDSPLALESFRAPLRALVFGASGGIGAACVDLLAPQPNVAAVYAASRTAPAPWNFSLEDEGSIAGVAAAAAAAGPLDLVIVATGVLHAENLSGCCCARARLRRECDRARVDRQAHARLVATRCQVGVRLSLGACRFDRGQPTRRLACVSRLQSGTQYAAPQLCRGASPAQSRRALRSAAPRHGRHTAFQAVSGGRGACKTLHAAALSARAARGA
jgi:NAD(P)-dependent dehydrogenase (short-subunit alcohol dehydrogenase family)